MIPILPVSPAQMAGINDEKQNSAGFDFGGFFGDASTAVSSFIKTDLPAYVESYNTVNDAIKRQKQTPQKTIKTEKMEVKTVENKTIDINKVIMIGGGAVGVILTSVLIMKVIK